MYEYREWKGEWKPALPPRPHLTNSLMMVEKKHELPGTDPLTAILPIKLISHIHGEIIWTENSTLPLKRSNEP